MFVLDGAIPAGTSRSSKQNDLQILTRSEKYPTRLALTLYAKYATLEAELKRKELA